MSNCSNSEKRQQRHRRYPPQGNQLVQSMNNTAGSNRRNSSQGISSNQNNRYNGSRRSQRICSEHNSDLDGSSITQRNYLGGINMDGSRRSQRNCHPHISLDSTRRSQGVSSGHSISLNGSNSGSSLRFPSINQHNQSVTTRREDSSGIESCCEDDENPVAEIVNNIPETVIHVSRHRVLPSIQIGIESDLKICESDQLPTNTKPSNILPEKSYESIPHNLSFPSMTIKQQKSSEFIIYEKPNALPPIVSSDGIPDKINKDLQNSIVSRRYETQVHAEHRKRAQTHLIRREINRGDSWELLKAEKIRRHEEEQYDERMERERLQKLLKKKKRKSEKRNIGKKRQNMHTEQTNSDASSKPKF